MTTIVRDARHRRQVVRDQSHNLLPALHAIRPSVPAPLAAAVSCLIAAYEGLEQARATSPRQHGDRTIYDHCYGALLVVRHQLDQRLRYLIDYGWSVLAQIPATSPAARDLHARLTHTQMGMPRSLAGIVSSQAVLDQVISQGEHLIVMKEQHL
jgi:hypothetical protein